ncbi:MAG: hypothetical protein ABL893_00645 [Hyphomicrobium sp.]
MASPDSPAKFDDVLVVREIWDLPLSGVTLFDGGFYSFQRVYDEAAQGWAPNKEFMLQRLTGAELAQFNELHDRYNAWVAAYQAGKAGPHPLTPEATGPDADRYKELHQLTEAILFSDTDRTIRCTGELAMHPDKTRYIAQWQKI